MKYNYKMTRQGLKKLIMKDHFKYNIIYIFLASIFYFIMTAEFLTLNTFFTLLVYGGLLIVLFGVMQLTNFIYATLLIKFNDKKTNNNYGDFKCSIDANGLVSEGENNKVTIKWSEIKDIKFTSTRVYIKYENKDNLIFVLNKYFLEDEDLFDKIVEEIKKYR